jgi:hypothetical protein
MTDQKGKNKAESKGKSDSRFPGGDDRGDDRSEKQGLRHEEQGAERIEDHEGLRKHHFAGAEFCHAQSGDR